MSKFEKSKNAMGDAESQQDLLGLLMIALDERGDALGRKQLRNNAINLIVAGLWVTLFSEALRATWLRQMKLGQKK